MNILPLGVGNAMTKRFYHNNFLFDFDGVSLLVDCGTSLRFALQEVGIQYEDLGNVFITHCHYDHVGGLEELVTRRSKLGLTTTIYLIEELRADVLSVLAPGLGYAAIEQFCRFVLLNPHEPYTLRIR